MSKYRSTMSYRGAVGTLLRPQPAGKMRTDSVPVTVTTVRSFLDAADASVSDYLEGLVIALKAFTQAEPVLVSCLVQTSDYLQPGAPGLLDRVKKVSAYYRGLYTGLGPEVESWGIRLTGPWRRWVRSRLCGPMRRKSLAIFSAIWNAKTACRQMTDDEEREALVRHALGVSTETRTKDAFCDEFMVSMGPMINRVRRELERVSVEEQTAELLAELSFGTSAELTSPKSSGGVSGKIYKICVGRGSERFGLLHEYEGLPQRALFSTSRPLDVQLLKGKAHPGVDKKEGSWISDLQVGDIYYDGTSWLEVGTLGTLKMHRRAHGRYLTGATQADYGSLELYDHAVEWSESYNGPVLEYEVVAGHYGGKSIPVERWPDLERHRLELIRELLDYDGGDPWSGRGEDRPQARVSGVREPLKLRVVTIDELGLIVRSTLAQKVYHTALKRIPCFRLLGKAPGALDIMAVREACVSEDGGDLLAASSDFSGASDGIPMDLIRRLSRALTHGRPAWESRAFAEGIQPSCLLYPRKLKKSFRDAGVPFYELDEWPTKVCVDHERGTLMGRKVSFILLSLFVYGAHAVARRRMGLEPTFRGVLVNGDDRLSWTTKAFDDAFWIVCQEMNFGKSVGKSYLHQTYANINSQSYIIDDSGCVKVPSLKVGLLVGQKKLGDDFNPTTVVTELLDSCLDTSMEWRVMRMFLTLHKVRLRKILGGRNLFASSSLGGMGQRRPGDSRYGTWRFEWDKRADPRVARAYAATKLPGSYDISNDFRHDVRCPDFKYVCSPADPTGEASAWDVNLRLQDEEESQWNVFRNGVRWLDLDELSAKVPEWLFRNFSVCPRIPDDPRYATSLRGELTDDLTRNGLAAALEASGGLGAGLDDYDLDECQGVTKVTQWIGADPSQSDWTRDKLVPHCAVCLMPRIRPDGRVARAGPHKYLCWTCGSDGTYDLGPVLSPLGAV